MRYGEREPRGGLRVEPEVLAARRRVVAAAVAERRDSSLSAAELLAGLDLDPGAREAILSRLEVSTGCVGDRVAAGELAGVGAHSRDDCPSVAGGNQLVARRLAEGLGPAVHLRSPVDRVEWSEAGVRVRAAGSELVCDVAVVAVPASVIGRISFEPALPRRVSAAYADVEYGQAAKLFVPLREGAGAERCSLGAGALLDVDVGGGGRGGAAGRQRFRRVGSRALRTRRRRGAGAVARVDRAAAPDLEPEPEGAVLSTWADGPWAGAAYSVHTPGGNDPQLAERYGRLVLAGEYTAGPFAALMEGALRSGARAAAQLLLISEPS